VVELRAEEDGDLHIALADANGDKPGTVVAEIPAKPQWYELRKIAFGWAQVQFPFRVRSGRKLKLTQPMVITVIGRAFFRHRSRSPQITRTREPIFKARLLGKFIR
jgi:hypothetical protein